MKPRFIPSLDGVRALAVLFVLFFHWPYSTLRLPFGWIGVQIFFVLSGFLITRGLLHEKERELSLGSSLWNFYTKRILRIFPLYYLFLTFLAVLYVAFQLSSISEGKAALHELEYNWPYLVSYTYNFQHLGNLFLDRPWENSYLLSHLWSLSVEEQFYCVFPFLVFYLSRKCLQKVLVALFIFCPLLRFLGTELLWEFSPDWQWVGGVVYRSTFFQVDSLALGGLLALHEERSLPQVRLLFHLVLLLTLTVGIGQSLLLGESLQGLGFGAPELLVRNQRAVYGFTLINLCSVLLIACSVSGAPLFRFFEHPTVQYFGKISYGIYLFHPPVFWSLPLFIPKSWVLENRWIEFFLFPLVILLVFGICHLLYQRFEKRFLALKLRIDPDSLPR
ncbi:MAG: acyltransferase [Bdellovibrionales bacterium]|nr:acyltransferase [Bdellovibrionales bacterium]